MVDLASELGNLPARRGDAPWPNCEYVRGWGVFGLPFDSGHVLALRVFPDNSFSPYCTVWHRNPGGRWSIYVRGARLDTACPRYYGSACAYTGFARIGFEWTGPMSLRVTMDEPRLDWTVAATETRLLAVMNAVSPRLPLWTWKSSALLRARELLAKHLLHLGDIRLSGTTPSGHFGVLMPARMYFIEKSAATLAGRDLGRPTTLAVSPRIGEVTLAAHGALAVGQGVWKILDPAEYARTRSETAIR